MDFKKCVTHSCKILIMGNCRGSIWELFVFSVLFFYKPKTSLKNKVLVRHCKAQIRPSISTVGILFQIVSPVLHI